MTTVGVDRTATEMEGDPRPDTSELSEGAIFELLKNDRRRRLVELLAAEQDEQPIGDVADALAARESGGESTSDNLYKSVYVSLQQTHLPKLAEQDVVRYDRDRGVVSPGRNLDDVLAYTRLSADPPPKWQSGELVIALLGLCVTAGVLVGLPLVAYMPMEVWATIVFGTIIALNLARMWL